MATWHHDRSSTTAVLKVFYLIAVTAFAFMVPAIAATRPARWFVIPALLAFQVFALLVCRIPIREIVRPAWRLKWLFVFLIGCYTLLPPESPVMGDLVLHWRVPNAEWLLPFNVTGLERAALMCLQILTLLLASALVRLTGSGDDLVQGLRVLRVPALFVYSLDHTMALLGGIERRGGSRRDAGAQAGAFAALKRLLRGDVGAFVQSIKANIEVAGEQTRRETDRKVEARLAHDIATVSGIALCMASFKMLKFLPGLPFASGHKAILLFPLYVLAARLTHSRWGATAAGAIMGVIGFLQGDGRFGVLEILKHVAPGLLIDLADPLVRRLPVWAFGYCLLGLAAAIARTTTEFVLVLLLGARAEVYVFPAAKLVPNLLAGFLSGFVTMFVLRAFARATPAEHKLPEDVDGEARTKRDNPEAAP